MVVAVTLFGPEGDDLGDTLFNWVAENVEGSVKDSDDSQQAGSGKSRST